MIIPALLVMLAATPSDDGRLRRAYPFPPEPPTGTLICHPINRNRLECYRPDGTRFTCVPDPANVVSCLGKKS